MKSLISIITPTHNSAKYVEDTIKSVLAQDYLNWEMLIIDDCSTDSTVNIVQKYSNVNDRIKLIKLKKNVGAAMARNQGLKIASGQYIAFLDSDDYWSRNKLTTQLKFMHEKKCGISFTSYYVIKKSGNVVNSIIAPEIIDYNGYLKNTIIGCLTVMINKEIVGDIEFPLIKSSQDMALWLNILKRGHFAFGIKENLAFYRLTENSNTANKISAAIDVWNVYRTIEKLSLIDTLYNFSWYAFNAINKRTKNIKY